MSTYLSELLAARQSTRAFTDKPVSKTLLVSLLTAAGKSPSSSNMQPWKVYVLTGAAKQSLSDAALKMAQTSPMGGGSDLPIYPAKLAEPWYTRRAECGEKLYETLGISRQDKMGRMMQAAKNLSFFGAPVGLIFTQDRSLCESQLIDLGIFIQSIMLLAQEQGLATCAQASWSMWADVVRQQLDLSDNEKVILGMSLGYPNDDKINRLNQPRLPLDVIADFRGFADE